MGRYEDKLQIAKVVDTTRDPITGDFTPGNGDPVFETISDCRDEPNDKGSTITGADGEAVKYGSTIQLPEDCPEIERGTLVRVLNDEGDIILEGVALRFKRYRKNSRLWV